MFTVSSAPKEIEKGKQKGKNLHMRNIQRILPVPRLVQQERFQGEGGPGNEEMRAPHRLWRE